MIDTVEAKKKKEKDMVDAALHTYFMSGNDVNAGYNIIRFSKKGLIAVSEEVSPNVFMEWYPNNQAYVILRLAKKGLLKYKG